MLLSFRDATKLKTKPVEFHEIYISQDVSSGDQLKDLSYRRRLIIESINNSVHGKEHGEPTSQTKKVLQKLELYLPVLETMVMRIESLLGSSKMPAQKSKLKIEWSSSLVTACGFKLGGPKFFQSDNLRFELGMQLFLYGAFLREAAFETLSTGVADLAETATFFRKAAGVYACLSEAVLPPLQLLLPKDRPPEATTCVTSIMRLMCLADAQALAVKRAEEKGTSANLLSKLHYGVSQILDEAMSIIQSTPGKLSDVTPKLMELISTSSALHELRSKRHLAEDLRNKEKVGIAICLLQNALAKAKKLKAPRNDSWQSIFNKGVKDVGEVLKKMEHENDFVWHDKVPDADMLPVLEGKSIVSVIPYELQRP